MFPGHRRIRARCRRLQVSPAIRPEDGETGYYAAPKEYTDLYYDAKLTRPNVKPIRMNPNAQHILSKPDVPPAAGYFGAIASLDRNMGRLLQTLKDEGLSDNTIVIFTSDHGEMMTSQGLFGKKVWWEESVGVPFMVNWKGRVKPGHCDELFNGPDIAPTLLTLAGLKPQNGMEGLDFSPAVLGRKMTGPAEIYTAMFSELQFGCDRGGLARSHQQEVFLRGRWSQGPRPWSSC